MFKVYILQSIKNDRYYLGHTNNLDRRLAEHNNGFSSSTKAGIPWKIIWTENCYTRSDAMKLENKIKGRGTKRFLNEE
ncbi:MAG: GIY-YIG nuclease family protein [Ignavibacteriaceae bacterium]|jgi:putative endonuclease